MRQRSNGHDYLRITTSCAGIISHPYVHQLVCEAFHGPRPEGMAVRHFPDRTRSNNTPGNLSWATKAVNEKDKVFHDTINHGERNGQAILTECQVIEIRRRAASGASTVSLASEFGMSKVAINDAVTGRRWRYLADYKKTIRPFKKISDADVLEIRSNIAAGTARKIDLARRFGVKWETINRIANGRRRATVALVSSHAERAC